MMTTCRKCGCETDELDDVCPGCMTNLRITGPKQLRARASFVGEWIAQGLIDRPEGFRLEMDAYLGRDTGPVRWLSPNSD